MQNFKVGDWVILNKDRKTLAKILEIDDEYIFKCKLHFVNENSISWCSEMQYYKHWEPTEGEWCWFYKEEIKPKHIGTHWAIPNLHKFGKTTESGIQTIEGFCYSFCEPFIGQLPSFLKDNT